MRVCRLVILLYFFIVFELKTAFYLTETGNETTVYSDCIGDE